MVFTSVAGHLMELEFTAPFKKWRGCVGGCRLYCAALEFSIPMCAWGRMGAHGTFLTKARAQAGGAWSCAHARMRAHGGAWPRTVCTQLWPSRSNAVHAAWLSSGTRLLLPLLQLRPWRPLHCASRQVCAKCEWNSARDTHPLFHLIAPLPACNSAAAAACVRPPVACERKSTPFTPKPRRTCSSWRAAATCACAKRNPPQASMTRRCLPQDKSLMQQNLQQLSRGAQMLVLWLDCDREGENIGFEVRTALGVESYRCCTSQRLQAASS